MGLICKKRCQLHIFTPWYKLDQGSPTPGIGIGLPEWLVRMQSSTCTSRELHAHVCTSLPLVQASSPLHLQLGCQGAKVEDCWTRWIEDLWELTSHYVSKKPMVWLQITALVLSQVPTLLSFRKAIKTWFFSRPWARGFCEYTTMLWMFTFFYIFSGQLFLVCFF